MRPVGLGASELGFHDVKNLACEREGGFGAALGGGPPHGAMAHGGGLPLP